MALCLPATESRTGSDLCRRKRHPAAHSHAQQCAAGPTAGAVKRTKVLDAGLTLHGKNGEPFDKICSPLSHNCHFRSKLLSSAYSMPLPTLTWASSLAPRSERTRFVWLDLSRTGGDLNPELCAPGRMMCPLMNTLAVSALNIGFHGGNWGSTVAFGDSKKSRIDKSPNAIPKPQSYSTAAGYSQQMPCSLFNCTIRLLAAGDSRPIPRIASERVLRLS